MTFDPRSFLKSRSASSSTVVKCHGGWSLKLQGTAEEYTLSSVAQLARSQGDEINATSGKVELPDGAGHTVREKYTLSPTTAAAFIQGGTASNGSTSGKGKSKAEQRAEGSIPAPATNGAAS